MKRRFLSTLILTAAIATPCCWQLAMAADPAVPGPVPPLAPKATATGKAVVTRAYDVRDLLVVVKSYPLKGSLIPPTQYQEVQPPAAPAAVSTAPAVPPVPAPAVDPTPLDDLRRLIDDTVDTASWKDNGGDVGSMSAFNGELFITQTAENQAAVSNVLDELRKGRARMVRVHADWVLLSPGQLAKLLKPGGDSSALQEISRESLQSLPEGTVHYTGQVVCFSGQTVHLASGRAKNIITNVTPVVAPGAVALDPTVAYMHYGMSLEVTPTASNDSATLDMASIVSEGSTTTITPTTQPLTPMIDRLNNVVQNFHTTVQVPLSKPVLIGGGTADPTSDQPSGKELYLIIEADSGK